MSKKYTIVVAGGTGSRMGNKIPKQFLNLAGTPIIVHTLRKFLSINDNHLILVLPNDAVSYWNQIKINFFEELKDIPYVIGGQTRFQSVRNGLGAIPNENGVVIVHDAVRPLISVNKIKECFDKASICKALILCVSPKDSLRILSEDNKSKAIDRTTIRIVQTPQAFDLKLLKKAYLQEEQNWFTDDASVVENLGNEIFLLEGEYSNIKITTPEDLDVAETLLKNN
jgi:2-C-methyl-D-erythritol 4-phosphate cytidylyltransferase